MNSAFVEISTKISNGLAESEISVKEYKPFEKFIPGFAAKSTIGCSKHAPSKTKETSTSYIITSSHFTTSTTSTFHNIHNIHKCLLLAWKQKGCTALGPKFFNGLVHQRSERRDGDIIHRQHALLCICTDMECKMFLWNFH
jgi:hypothetical protein